MTERRNRSRRLRLLEWPPLAIAIALSIAPLMTTPDRADAFAGRAIMYYPKTVRSVGMGESGVSDRTDPGNVYLNPANVTAVDGVYSTGSYQVMWPNYSDYSLGHISVGFGQTLKRERPLRLAFDLTYSKLKYGDPQYETYIALTAGMNVEMGKRAELALGFAFKRWWDKYDNPRTVFLPEGTGRPAGDHSANMFDAGAVVTVNLDASGWLVQPMLGLAVLNMGSDIEISYDSTRTSVPSPTWFKYGVTAHVESPHITLRAASVPTIAVTLNFQGTHSLEKQQPFWGIGAEIAVVQTVFVRWGRRMDDDRHGPAAMWGAAVGIPHNRARLRIEYAHTDRSRSDKFGFTFVYLLGGE